LVSATFESKHGLLSDNETVSGKALTAGFARHCSAACVLLLTKVTLSN